MCTVFDLRISICTLLSLFGVIVKYIQGDKRQTCTSTINDTDKLAFQDDDTLLLICVD